MNSSDRAVKEVLIFIGLPYTGKTTLIRCLQERVQGRALYVDEILTQIVPASEINLTRWLEEGSRLVAEIEREVAASSESHFYIELGIMQTEPRNSLIHWCQEQGYKVALIWCQCNEPQLLQQRHQTRMQKIGKGNISDAQIDITLGDLYRRIRTAFEQPRPEEGYCIIDTSQLIDESLKIISAVRPKS